MQDLQYVPKGSTMPGVSCLFSHYMDLSNRSKSSSFFPFPVKLRLLLGLSSYPLLLLVFKGHFEFYFIK